jgi:hypothetical protein
MLTMLAAAGATAGPTDAARPGDRPSRSFDVGLWGDLPYTEEQRTRGVPNLIADMNASDLAFSVFDGDIKNGSSPCTNEEYAAAAARFNALEAPAVYVPGDNEWTDCHRRRAGGYDPLERLAHLRATMFATRESFGQERIRLTRQSAAYPENVRWRHRRVLFVTLNVQGSNNNRINDVNAPESNSDRTPADRAAANAEYVVRDAANEAWLRSSFALAERTGARGVMVVIQANPGFEVTDPAERAAEGLNGYDNFLEALREETVGFERPVALVHGDSHTFQINKPMRDAGGGLVENFTRVETFGETDPHWVRATVDPRDEDVFSFRAEVVDENVVP